MKTHLFKWVFTLVSLAASTFIYGQQTLEIAGAEYGAFSNAGVSDQNVWQNLLNPAGIISTETKWQAAASYTNRFGLNELSSRNVVGSVPLKKGRLGLTIHSFGYSAYLQNQFSAAYAMELNPKLRAGIQLNYYSINVGEGFGRYTGLTANLGFQYDFNSKVSAGIVIKNPNRSQLDTEVQEYIQSIIQGGIRFKLADNLTVLTDLNKDIEFSPWLSLGIDYQPIESWFLRGGIATNNNSISFGFGYKPAKWSIDFASLYHQTLGFSPMISFTYRNE